MPFSFFLHFLAPDTARILLSAVIFIILLIYLLYLVAYHELRSRSETESLLYLDTSRKKPFSLLYVMDEPADGELCAYRENGFIKLRVNHEDRFVCPFDRISYSDSEQKQHQYRILTRINGTFFDEKKYLKIAAAGIAVVLGAVILLFTLNQKQSPNFHYFFENHISGISVPAQEGFGYNPPETFQDYQFILTVCESPDHTAEFMKLFCINGKNYTLHVMTLNLCLSCNGKRFADDVNQALQEQNSGNIPELVMSYFHLRTDALVILNYDAMSSLFDAETMNLTVEQDLYNFRHTAEHRPLLDTFSGNHSYAEAIDIIEQLHSYTEQCRIENKNGVLYLEQIGSDLENDLLFSVISAIGKKNYDDISCPDCVLTDISEEQFRKLCSVIQYRPSTFANQFHSEENRIVHPYLAECEVFYTAEDGRLSAFVPEGCSDSRMIKELYYTLLRK